MVRPTPLRSVWSVRAGAALALGWALGGSADESLIAGAAPGAPDAADSVLTELAAPLLRDWIIQSRNNALAEGVRPIPAEVRSALTGYVPGEILDRVRWRVGGGGELSLQSSSFYFAGTPAITLDHVVVFRREEDAHHNPELWAHELRHVMQFSEWGVEGFAVRYLLDASAVESEASRFRWEWVFTRSR